MKDVYSWELYGMDRVHELAQENGDYRELNQRREEILHRYEEVLGRLSEEDREALLDYECVCADMQFAQTKLAYELGRGTPGVLVSPL